MCVAHARPTLFFARALLNLFFLVLRGQSGRGTSAAIHLGEQNNEREAAILLFIGGVDPAPLYQALKGE